MSTIADLLFELANADRLMILSEIEKAPLKPSEIARKLSATIQETSRHLERLSKARLVEKNSTSSYQNTSFGRLVLSLLPSLDFLQKRRSFFLSHDLSSLPQRFVQRVGELSDGDAVERLDDALAQAERIVKEAEQYLWLMADQNVRQSYPHEHPAQVSRRLLVPRGVDLQTFQRIRRGTSPELQIGFLDDVKVTIFMNEKSALVGFPGLDGRMDFTQGFAGKAPKFHGWCQSLYSCYWDASSKKTW
jgi:predicted transcriptional regulator